jgi:hypothetical protein
MGIKGSPPSQHPHAKTNARPLRGGQVSTTACSLSCALSQLKHAIALKHVSSNAQLKHAIALKQAVAGLCEGGRFSSALLPLILRVSSTFSATKKEEALSKCAPHCCNLRCSESG